MGCMQEMFTCVNNSDGSLGVMINMGTFLTGVYHFKCLYSEKSGTIGEHRKLVVFILLKYKIQVTRVHYSEEEKS